MIVELHEWGREQIRGTRSRRNFRNSVIIKFWELQILGTWSELKLRPYLYVKVEIELKMPKDRDTTNYTCIWVDWIGYDHYQVTKA